MISHCETPSQRVTLAAILIELDVMAIDTAKNSDSIKCQNYKNIFILKYGQTNLASDLHRFYTLTNDIGTAHKI